MTEVLDYTESRRQQDTSLPEQTGTPIDVVDPFTGQTWARVTRGDSSTVAVAVEAARKAADDGWSRSLPVVRARLLRRLAALVEDHSERLARLQVRENGKLLKEMLAGTRSIADALGYAAGLAETLEGRTIPVSVPNMFTYTVREPVGVVAVVTPWNSPLTLLNMKVAPALAAGNTVVAKPSEITPVSTLEFAKLFEEAGFPPGVFNVVTGDVEAGRALVSHDDIDLVAFTGSTGAGREIARTTANRLINTVLELGGKSPNIVFDDADIESAVNGVIGGIFQAGGQSCVAGSRILVQDSIYDPFLRMLRERADAIVLGDPTDSDTELGPLSCRPQYDKVNRMVAEAVEDGAIVVTSRSIDGDLPPEGLFVRPTLFVDVPSDAAILREEVFGPVGCVIRFSTEEEAIRLANDTSFGLAAGVWTESIQRAHRIVPHLRAGTVWVNSYRAGSYVAPFGGYKDSGLGRENGTVGIEEFTEIKTVWIDSGPTLDPFRPRL